MLHLFLRAGRKGEAHTFAMHQVSPDSIPSITYGSPPKFLHFQLEIIPNYGSSKQQQQQQK